MQRMSKHWGCGALVLIIALWWATPMPVHALPFTPAVEYSTISTLGGPFATERTIGYQFNMSVPFVVDALAYRDDGLVHAVGLWNSTGGNVIQTTVSPSDPLQGHFRYVSGFSTGLLPPGDYTIGGQSNSGPFPSDAVGVVTVPGFTWITDVQAFGAGLNYPTSSSGGAFGQNGILAPNFSISFASAVPESSSVILLRDPPRLWPCWHPRLRLATEAGRITLAHRVLTDGGSSDGAAVFVWQALTLLQPTWSFG